MRANDPCSRALGKQNMKIKPINALVFGVVGFALVGCSIGMQPEGPTSDQIKAKMAAMPPEKQIELIQNSPMKPDEKATKIAEIKQKFGIK